MGSDSGNRRKTRLARPLDEHISASTQLARLRDEARALVRATRRMRHVLDPVLGDHLEVARSDEHEVVVVADGAAWATHARFIAPVIAESLWPDLEPGARPRVRILVSPPRTQAQPRPKPTPSPGAAPLIDEVAEQFAGSKLGDALKRLAAQNRG